MDFGFINKLKSSTAAILILTMGALSMPGALVIFLFKPELYFQLDFFKLVLLSSAISFPIFAYFCMVCAMIVKWTEEPEVIGLVGAFMAIIGSALFLLLAYLGMTPFREFAKMISIIALAIMAFYAIFGIIQQRSEKKRVTEQTEQK